MTESEKKQPEYKIIISSRIDGTWDWSLWRFNKYLRKYRAIKSGIQLTEHRALLVARENYRIITFKSSVKEYDV